MDSRGFVLLIAVVVLTAPLVACQTADPDLANPDDRDRSGDSAFMGGLRSVTTVLAILAIALTVGTLAYAIGS